MKMGLRDIQCGTVDCIQPVVRFCERGNEPFGSIKVRNFLTSCITVSLLRTTLQRRISLLQIVSISDT
jgi:hypothetical protein